jgi:hypothetical protein
MALCHLNQANHEGNQMKRTENLEALKVHGGFE